MQNRKHETRRLCLLHSDPSLAKKVADYYCRNKDFFRDTDPHYEDDFYTEPGQRSFLHQISERQKAGYEQRFWLVTKDFPERIIGMVSLNNIVMGAFRSCFLSYKLDCNQLRQGYMTEALEYVSRYAFDELRLHRLEANIMPRNTASLKTVEKLGFRNEGLSPKYLRINHVWEDHVHMVLLNQKLEECHQQG